MRRQETKEMPRLWSGRLGACELAPQSLTLSEKQALVSSTLWAASSRLEVGSRATVGSAGGGQGKLGGCSSRFKWPLLFLAF